ncbi:MAG: amidohydrolase family protein, partial [Clostridia bacterium]|nr:amidohydrolase family protein [Clostridia bacterium]
MKIYIKNALLITMDEGKIFPDGCVITDGSKISYAGEAIPKPADCKKEIDARGGIVMPGLINAHTHSPMTLLRGCADDLPLDVWLTEHIFPLEDRL